ncbi:MAG: methionine biosynthesis protein MetW [Chloroflexota bacterium]
MPATHRPPLADLRSDLQVIAGLVEPDVSVLDLGCGDGALLAHLIQYKQVKGRGIELSEEGVLACVRRGLSVRQGNLQEGLADYPDGSFDYVILSQTLPYLDDPDMVLNEMLRVGQRAIISFPNWAYWQSRLALLVRGHMPEAPDYPVAWYTTPRWQALTIADFRHFCERQGFRVRKDVYLSGSRLWSFAPNWLAKTAVFVLENTGIAAQ